MIIRKYNPEIDKDAVRQIWRETGWISKDEDEPIQDIFLNSGLAMIAELDGRAESLVISAPGSIKYLNNDIPFSAITGVTTSRVARKQGLASRLTAAVIAQDAANGVAVSGLGVFEQGYYDKLGFGSDAYTHTISFDPAQLNINQKPRPPKRLTTDDWQQMHNAILNRHRCHAACTLTSPEETHGAVSGQESNFGLGFSDGPNDELTHFIWCIPEGGSGSFRIELFIYQNKKQFLELLALIKTLSDQVRVVSMIEPHDIQMQDLITQPFRFRQATRKSEFENSMHSSAHSQTRICNLQTCLENTHLQNGDEVTFNITLTDPIETLLDNTSPWQGVGGNYIITLGPDSNAQTGNDKQLPTLNASVNAFTRLWLGVKPASSLAFTDDLAGPDSLLSDLDNIIRLPRPQRDWYY